MGESNHWSSATLYHWKTRGEAIPNSSDPFSRGKGPPSARFGVRLSVLGGVSEGNRRGVLFLVMASEYIRLPTTTH